MGSVLNFESGQTRVVEIVITGGSCAGKTTSLALLAQSLRDKGYPVLTAPETATLLFTSGAPKFDSETADELGRACQFQRQMFTVQRALRTAYYGLAELFIDETVVVLYDRGELDAIAYHGHDCIAEYAAEEGTTLDQIRDSYSAVMHLVTTADGAEKEFSLSNNPARWDSLDEACMYDQRILRLWQKHPRHTVIDNSTDFIGKMERLSQAVMRVIREVDEEAELENPPRPLAATAQFRVIEGSRST